MTRCSTRSSSTSAIRCVVLASPRATSRTLRMTCFSPCISGFVTTTLANRSGRGFSQRFVVRSSGELPPTGAEPLRDQRPRSTSPSDPARLPDEQLCGRTDARPRGRRARTRGSGSQGGLFCSTTSRGCAMSDIAANLGIPLFTAYSRLRVAREEFRAAVQRIQLKRGER